MPDIYLLIEGQQEGPYTEDQVLRSISEGHISSDLPAWHDGLSDWVPVEVLITSSVKVTPYLSAPANVSSTSTNTKNEGSPAAPPPSPSSIQRFFPHGQSFLSKNPRWLVAGFMVLVLLLSLYISSLNLFLRGTYRTADSKESITIFSSFGVDFSNGPVTVTGHYERQGNSLRLVIKTEGLDQVYHYTIVKEGLQFDDGTMYLSPRYFDAVQLCNQAYEKCLNRDFDGAISDYNQVISIYPNYQDVYPKLKYAQALKVATGAATPMPHDKVVELVTDLSSRADAGDIEAARELGRIYLWGKDVPVDYVQALKWVQIAASHDDALAQNDLGVMYSNGLGVQKDDAQAFSWFLKSANQGDAIGEFNVASMYFNGVGVTQDYSQGFSWCQKSAAQNNPNAEYMLGSMYDKGQGVASVMSTAKEWYEKAAAQGQVDAKDAVKRLDGN